MNKLYYCSQCKRVINDEWKCSYCSGEEVKELAIGAPVNVIGSKLKGNVLKISGDNVSLVIRDESNNKFVREYSADKIRKIL
jgi:hypothetical protein